MHEHVIGIFTLARFHRIQSTLARVVTMPLGRISISKTLSDLHWLPMKFRVDFKVATLTFKVLETGELGYLYSRTLRSSADIRKLSVIPSKTTIGARAFRNRRSGTVYHWTFAALHLYNRSSQG